VRQTPSRDQAFSILFEIARSLPQPPSLMAGILEPDLFGEVSGLERAGCGFVVETDLK
jgi:hypothetical protein